MSITVAVVSAKGGAGKTTTAVTLAHLLTEQGLDTVLIDLDPQAGASTTLGAFDGDEQPPSLVDVAEGLSLANACRRIEALSFDLIAASDSLARLDILLERTGELNPAMWLSRKLRSSPWAVHVLDCPPAFGPLPVSALLAADVLVIPTEPAPLALAAVGETLRRRTQAEESLEREISVYVVPSRVDLRRRLDQSALKQLATLSGLGRVTVASPIRAAVAVPEATDARSSILGYAPDAPVTADYRAALAPLLVDIRRLLNGS